MKAVIEMPMGTRYKYEIDKKSGALVLDRPIKSRVPYNYGFIPGTLCEDGDAIDVFVASSEPIPSLAEVRIRVVGAISGLDGGKRDDKILAFVFEDKFSRDTIPMTTFVGEVKAYLETYKAGFKILDLWSASEAIKMIAKVRV